MKLMIASDIHGSAHYCGKLVDAFRREGAEKLVLLGDILYHGPRNPFPDKYEPMSVIDMLNSIKEKLICVRGNCDTEVDQMVLNFPILADYCVVFAEGKRLYATHGHRFGEDNPPPLQEGDILVCGHTHIPKCVQHGGYLYINPGSVSLPKENSPHGYIILQGDEFLWKDLNADGKGYSSHRYNTLQR